MGVCREKSLVLLTHGQGWGLCGGSPWVVGVWTSKVGKRGMKNTQRRANLQLVTLQ